jgi:hypothetical protein
MVVSGSWIFPDDAQVPAVAERSLILNQHHATPLGVIDPSVRNNDPLLGQRVSEAIAEQM